MITDWDTTREESRFLGAAIAYLGPIGRDSERLFKLLDSGVNESWFQDSNRRDLFLGLFRVAISIGQEGIRVTPAGAADAAEEISGETGWARRCIAECQDAAGYLEFDELITKEIPLWWDKLKRPKLIELLGKADQSLHLPPSRRSRAEMEILLQKALYEWQAEPETREIQAGLLDRIRQKVLKPLPADTRIPTGLKTLDGYLGGGLSGSNAPDAGRLIIVCARPAMGKTQVAVNLAMRVAAAGSAVAFWSLEMQDEQIGLRMIAAWDHAQCRAAGAAIGGSLTYADLRAHSIEGPIRDRLESENYAAIDANLSVFNGGSNLTPERLCHQMRLFARRNPATRLFIVDHLGLLQMDSNGNRAIAVGDATRMIKTTAVELGIDVALLAQLNRGVESRAEKMPTLSDLRDSGRIEEDADVVLALHRPFYYTPNQADKYILNIGVLKNRQGGSGHADALIDLDCCAVYDPDPMEI